MRKPIAKTTLFPGLFAAAVLLSAVGAAHAYTYLGAARMGDMVVGSGLRSYAMGGTGIGGSDEAATILYNPATMNWAGPKQMTLAFAYAPVTERTVTSDKKSYYNENASFALNNFAIIIPTPDGRFGFGLAYAPLNDYNYRHKQILYSITSPATRTGYKEVVSAGAINRITPAVSFKFIDQFSVGLSYSMLSGSLDYSQKEISSSGGTDTIVTSLSSNRSVSGSRLDFGAVYSGLAPLRLGVAYYGATTLTMKSGSVEANMDMPAYIGLGVAWDFGGRYNTKLAFDFTPIPFSSAKINSAPSGLSD
ncbi:MAG: hypothetical protein QME32_05075, partial [Endomicrobiia bacterium]|nr:hypothetical protein [Endomicrobiia bacterium]